MHGSVKIARIAESSRGKEISDKQRAWALYKIKPRRSFYRAANSVFVKVGRVASEEVTIQLFNSKCLPVLLYGLEACSLSKSDLSSIDFAFNRFFMKLFRTNNTETVKVSQSFFGISLPSVVLRSRTDKFEQKFSLCADLVKALV